MATIMEGGGRVRWVFIYSDKGGLCRLFTAERMEWFIIVIDNKVLSGKIIFGGDGVLGPSAISHRT